MQNFGKNDIRRLIDANYNRSKEGLRVCEDICRFLLNDKNLTRNYKEIRHDLTGIASRFGISEVLKTRNISQDVGKKTIALEWKRKKPADIFYANSQRVKESVRVLEEFSKLNEKSIAERFKKLRYRIYALEKRISEKI